MVVREMWVASRVGLSWVWGCSRELGGGTILSPVLCARLSWLYLCHVCYVVFTDPMYLCRLPFIIGIRRCAWHGEDKDVYNAPIARVRIFTRYPFSVSLEMYFVTPPLAPPYLWPQWRAFVQVRKPLWFLFPGRDIPESLTMASVPRFQMEANKDTASSIHTYVHTYGGYILFGIFTVSSR